VREEREVHGGVLEGIEHLDDVVPATALEIFRKQVPGSGTPRCCENERIPIGG
jgi:hypothetical protein